MGVSSRQRRDFLQTSRRVKEGEWRERGFVSGEHAGGGGAENIYKQRARMSWNPTHVQVSIQRARDLIAKGKNGTNDAFCTIALKGEKYQTSIKDKAIDPEWYEECDVGLPENYHEEEIQLTLFHRNNLGMDEFLGRASIPLRDFDVYDAPRAIWYNLLCKPGQNKSKPRGELEARLCFVVNKVKDPDSISTASSASKRLKISKKAMKHAASALGKKIKGSKAEKTSDYVPDLTGLDTGIAFDDIAENYASVSVPARKLSDSLSLPPSSPSVRRQSKFSPFNNRHSKTEESETSSHASNEDVNRDVDDMSWRTHKRGGSDSNRSDVVNGKPPKPNRRQLTAAKLKAVSTLDISNTKSEFEFVKTTEPSDDSVLSSRTRTITSSSHASNEALPKVEESATEEISKRLSSHQRKSSGSHKPIQRPELVDDESDSSSDDPTPSPLAIKIKTKEGPADMFSNLDEKMEREKEEEESISMMANRSKDLIDTDNMFTPMPKKPEVEHPHSTPNVTRINDQAPSVQTPANVFDLLMASDEPETCVDDSNPFAESDVPVDMSQEKNEQTSGNPFAEYEGSSNPFETTEKSTKSDVISVIESNPFDEPRGAVKVDIPQRTAHAEVKVIPIVESNPFEKQTSQSSQAANPFEEPPEDSNPFEGTSNLKMDNPFEETPKESNPFEDETDLNSTNPFKTDDSEAEGDLNTRGSFKRMGSTKFGRSGRRSKESNAKAKKKSAAPAPPKPVLVDDNDKHTAVEPPPKPARTPETQKKQEQPAVAKSESPKTSMFKKKDKKAPKAPTSTVARAAAEQSLMASAITSPRSRSSSHVDGNTTEIASSGKLRSMTDTGRLETVKLMKTTSGVNAERQPAVGAESPDQSVRSEKLVCTAEIGVQVTETQEGLPQEFRNCSKQDLIETIQRLRGQVRKKEEHVRDLEEYIDSLLLRVMSSDPNMLVASTHGCAQQATKMGR